MLAFGSTMSTPVPMRFPDTQLLWTVPRVYTPQECEAIVEKIESWAPSLATNNPIYRDQDRVMRDDPKMAEDLFARLRPHLPPTIGDLSLRRLNERLRFYRYQAGQRFAPHMDHWYQPNDREITLLTVLVYFNGDFEGGETQFEEQLAATVAPEPGLVAVFQHKVRHAGCPVQSGTKYAMRTDVLYEAPDTIELTYASE